jgi:hypothetical protein
MEIPHFIKALDPGVRGRSHDIIKTSRSDAADTPPHGCRRRLKRTAFPMKRISSVVCAGFSILFFCGSATARDEIPRIQNLSIEKRIDGRSLAIRYDLEDVDDDSIRVALDIFCGDALHPFTSSDSLTGDVGFPVIPGRGKEIVWHYSNRPAADDSADLRVRITADDFGQADIPSMLAEINVDTVLDRIRFLEGPRHRWSSLAHLENVKNDIEDLFRRYGLETERQTFQYGDYTAANITGTKPGSDGQSTILLNAHFDSVSDSPGADDNATGVAGVLEAARVLSGHRFRHTIRFMATDLEEEGYVGDARYIADALPLGENIFGVFNLDMIGYSSDAPSSQQLPYPEIAQILFPEEYDEFARNEFRGDFLLNMADENSSEWLSRFEASAARHVPELKVITLAVPEFVADWFGGLEDYPYWVGGYRSTVLSDGGGEYRNPYYHTPGDSIGTLHPPFLWNVVKAVVAATVELAGYEHTGMGWSDPFRIEAFDAGIAHADADPVFELHENFPDPFNPSTRISYSIPRSGVVTLRLYDALGREIRTLTQGVQGAGEHTLVFHADALPSGVYLYRLQHANDFTETRKMVLMR